jgi:hypothetical protein
MKPRLHRTVDPHERSIVEDGVEQAAERPDGEGEKSQADGETETEV